MNFSKIFVLYVLNLITIAIRCASTLNHHISADKRNEYSMNALNSTIMVENTNGIIYKLFGEFDDRISKAFENLNKKITENFEKSRNETNTAIEDMRK